MSILGQLERIMIDAARLAEMDTCDVVRCGHPSWCHGDTGTRICYAKGCPCCCMTGRALLHDVPYNQARKDMLQESGGT